MINKPVVQ